MKNFTFVFLCCLFSSLCFAQGSYTLDKLDSWDNDNLPTHFFGTFNDCWGYAANGREYAIMGSASYVHIFDVTDPTNIVEISEIFLGPSSSWRDFKTYQNRLYGMADSSNEGLSIIDLSTLPASASLIKQVSTEFQSAHNLFINEGRLYVVGGPGSMIIYDLTVDPDNPEWKGTLNLQETYIHDLYVKNNIAYCSSAYDGLFVWDLNDIDNPVLLSKLSTNGYNHSNWLSDDEQTLIIAEEVPLGLPLLSVDNSGVLNNDLMIDQSFKFPNITDAATSSDVTPHNPYIIGDLLYVSYYEDGIHIYDWSTPSDPVKIATYDTYPDNDIVGSEGYGYNGYAGCWGVYPFLPSGNIIVSDMDYGLFMLELNEEAVSTQNIDGLDQIRTYPNPTTDEVNLSLNTSQPLDLTLQLTDITGKVLMNQKVKTNGLLEQQIDLSQWSKGMYFLIITDGKSTIAKKLTKM